MCVLMFTPEIWLPRFLIQNAHAEATLLVELQESTTLPSILAGIAIDFFPHKR